MPQAYSEDQLVEQPAIRWFAKPGHRPHGPEVGHSRSQESLC